MGFEKLQYDTYLPFKKKMFFQKEFISSLFDKKKGYCLPQCKKPFYNKMTYKFRWFKLNPHKI